MSNSRPYLSRKIAVGVMIAIALAAGMVVGGMDRGGAVSREASDAASGLERYEIGGELDLTDQRGERVRLGDLSGRAVMLFFGYTYCPDICPATLARMRSVKAVLPPDAAARFVGVLVSVDPARDTPERLGEYVEFFDPGFIGLTGAVDELKRVARRYGAVFEIPEGQPEDRYLVNHSTFGYLIDPTGQVRALYSGEEPIEEIAAHVREVLRETG